MAAKHILTCIDFSDQSIKAIDEIAGYARSHGSRVTLLHVADPQAFIPPQAVLEPAATPQQAEQKVALEKLRDTHLRDIAVDVVVLEDHATARAITDYAEANGVDLIVVGSHGRGGMERWLIGSVAERVVRHAKANVFVVRH
jgi:nucleotide-binding universal stress UspA family protein